jgi:hypothetical protein
MSLYDFVVPLGITSLSVALLTVGLGVFRKRIPAKPRVLMHKICGFVLLALALTHGGIVFYFTYLAH